MNSEAFPFDVRADWPTPEQSKHPRWTENYVIPSDYATCPESLSRWEVHVSARTVLGQSKRMGWPVVTNKPYDDEICGGQVLRIPVAGIGNQAFARDSEHLSAHYGVPELSPARLHDAVESGRVRGELVRAVYQPNGRRRVWQLGLLTDRDAAPLAMVLLGGREGDDVCHRWVFDPASLADALLGGGASVRRRRALGRQFDAHCCPLDAPMVCGHVWPTGFFDAPAWAFLVGEYW